MKYAVVVAALVAAVSAQTPPGCSTNFDGTFEISPANVTLSNGKRAVLEARQACTNTPVSTLKDGVLTDQTGRTGGIVANHQFQYDEITQPDSLFLSGFSICANGTLAVGGSAIFYSCISGGFSNLYNEDVAAQCSEVYLYTHPCEGGSAAQSGATGSTGPSSTTSSSSPSVASTPSTTSTTSAASTPSTTSTTSAETVSTPAPVVPVPVTTSATVIPPFPVGNTTTTSATATGSAPVTSTPGASTTAPVPFDNGANLVTIGGQLFAVVAGLAAFAMF